VFPVKYELGFYIPEDGILLGPRRENLKCYKSILFSALLLAILNVDVFNVLPVPTRPSSRKSVTLFSGKAAGRFDVR
jgi:hypothetical protein